MRKPGYRLTRQAFWLSFLFAWGVIGAIVYHGVRGSEQAVALANIVVPSMIVLIAALLGIHRFSGAMDFRAMTDRTFDPPSLPPYLPRDQPEEGSP
ncbi:hypothetical protein [Rhizobium sp. YS-1r]|uniref:hypothetical protein n=1 Tax=Rhizobium sp. YS-1r TaxID=1532558 RepID=UPI00068EAC6A|nr:hypothetical protein [Rhizobium sp. YS-1r]